MRQPAAALLAFLRRENLFRLMGVIVVLGPGTGAAGLTYFEENRPFYDALWWAIVTSHDSRLRRHLAGQRSAAG